MTPRAARGRSSTAAMILATAEDVIQRKGYSGFSYADVAAELRVTKAALHYHFPGKAQLGEALIATWGTRFTEALASLDAAGGPALAMLDGYIKLHAEIIGKRKMCLCAMLAAEYQTLPTAMRAALVRFFDHRQVWLEGILEQGRSEGTLQFGGAARDSALLIISALEGAMLLAVAHGDLERFNATVTSMVAVMRGPE
jgi:TetR/AcrR family transcriptional repressor of nem operon